MITPAEIASLTGCGYATAGLCAARWWYHNFDWSGYTTDGEKAAFSTIQILIWPFTVVFLFVAGFISAPTRKERKAKRLKAAEQERADRAVRIQRMERELGIGQPDPPPPPPTKPQVVLGAIKAAMGIPPRMPDHRCSLCIPGRPSSICPFNSVCQK